MCHLCQTHGFPDQVYLMEREKSFIKSAKSVSSLRCRTVDSAKAKSNSSWSMSDVFKHFEQLKLGSAPPVGLESEHSSILPQKTFDDNRQNFLFRRLNKSSKNYDNINMSLSASSKSSMLSARRSAGVSDEIKLLHRLERRYAPYLNIPLSLQLREVSPLPFIVRRKLRHAKQTSATSFSLDSRALHYDVKILSRLVGALDESDFAGVPSGGLATRAHSHYRQLSKRSPHFATCSTQARKRDETASNSPPDQISANELAGYIEEVLHLPKRMSYMAENMYT